MDILGGLHVVYFTLNQVANVFNACPRLVQSKKGWELFIGCELVRIVQDEMYTKYRVGFPLKAGLERQGQSAEYILKKLLTDTTSIVDEYTDICVAEEGKENKVLYQFQITRLKTLKHEKQSASGIIRLLRKKFKVQCDKCVYLLIHVEEDASVNLHDVFAFLKTQDVPFGGIYISGQASRDGSTIRYCRIYPDYATYHVRLDLLT